MADQPEKRAKRRVKNPESFRERALKAADVTTGQKRSGRLKRALALPFKPLKPIVGPLKRGWNKVWSVQPFKTIAKLLRWLGLIIAPPYLRNSWKELRLVTWPNWKQSRQLTFAVLAFAVVFGSAVAAVDYGLDKLFRHILLR